MGLLDKLLGKDKAAAEAKAKEEAAAKAAAEEAARKRREELAEKQRMIEEAQKRSEEELAKRKAEMEAKAKAEADAIKARGDAMAAAMRQAVEQAAPKAEEAVKTYVVKSGDSLSKIAKELLGDAKRWPELYELNKALIGDNPNLIHPGQELKLPK